MGLDDVRAKLSCESQELLFTSQDRPFDRNPNDFAGNLDRVIVMIGKCDLVTRIVKGTAGFDDDAIHSARMG